MKQNTTIYARAIETIRAKSAGQPDKTQHEITINFHPDRYTPAGLPLLVSIANDQCLKSQFETGSSNGGLSAYKGGARWQWEQRVFDGVYDTCEPGERPKYGALNHKQLETGASPRFGSAFFRLQPHALQRSTFCYPDSYFEPDHFATCEYLAPLIALANSTNPDPLDAYIEAQIHGPINLQQDVAAIVLDPVFRGTEIEHQAQQLPIETQWHNGFELSTSIIAQHVDYRGQETVGLAKEIAIDEHINPQILGMAVNQSGYNPQAIKKVWHYLARFGYQSKLALE